MLLLLLTLDLAAPVEEEEEEADEETESLFLVSLPSGERQQHVSGQMGGAYRSLALRTHWT